MKTFLLVLLTAFTAGAASIPGERADAPSNAKVKELVASPECRGFRVLKESPGERPL